MTTDTSILRTYTNYKLNKSQQLVGQNLKSNTKKREFYLERLSHGVHTFSQSASGWFAVAFEAGGQEAAAAAAMFLHKKSKYTSYNQS